MAKLDNRLREDQIEEKLNDLEAEIDEEQEDVETEEEIEDDIDEDVETEDNEEDIDEDVDSSKEDKPQNKTPKDPDYKEKFKASTQEAQILASKNKKLTETIEQASQITDIDEAELLQEYPDWNELSATQKKIAKDTLINNKRFEMINGTVLDGKKVDEWAQKVDTFLDDDAKLAEFPSLNGRDQEFKAFCMKPSRRGVDIEDLASAFLHQSPVGSQRKKGSLLLTGGNSGEHQTKPAKMDAEGAAALRRRSPTAYMRAVKEGKIEVDV